MSFVAFGITHCENCGREIPMNRFNCPYCEEKKQQNREQKLSNLLELTDDEIIAIKLLAKEKAKEIKQEKINQKLKN